MPLPLPPFTIVADAVLQTLRAVDWSQFVTPRSDGTPGVTLRHWRGVNAAEEERPAVLVRIDADEAYAGDVSDGYGVYSELRMNLAMSLVIDADLDTSISDLDPTGLAQLGGYAMVCMRALKDRDDGLIYQVADDVQESGRGPGEDNTSDEGRLVQNINVIYRVREDDPSKLLAKGVDA